MPQNPIGSYVAKTPSNVMAPMRLDVNGNLVVADTAVHGFAITPSDTTVFANPTRSIWVGGPGALTVVMTGDTAPVTLSAVPAGTQLKISVVKVMATNTAATLITGLY